MAIVLRNQTRGKHFAYETLVAEFAHNVCEERLLTPLV